MTEELMQAIRRYDGLRRHRISIQELLKDEEQKMMIQTEVRFINIPEASISVTFDSVKPLVLEYLTKLNGEIAVAQRKLEAAMAAFKEA